MPETLTIPARFNGPPSSANGGYSCGLVARLVGAEEVAMSLRAPPPLERPLEVVRDGERVELREGDAVVAEGAPEELRLDVPEPVAPQRGGRGLGGGPHALVSWPLSVDGRKRQAACALFDSEGRLLCASRALWIELRG